MTDFNARTFLDNTLKAIENKYSDILPIIIKKIDNQLHNCVNSGNFNYCFTTYQIETLWKISLDNTNKLDIIRYLCEYYYKNGFIVFHTMYPKNHNYSIHLAWGNFVVQDEKIF